jgi:hypothetical protein
LSGEFSDDVTFVCGMSKLRASCAFRPGGDSPDARTDSEEGFEHGVVVSCFVRHERSACFPEMKSRDRILFLAALTPLALVVWFYTLVVHTYWSLGRFPNFGEMPAGALFRVHEISLGVLLLGQPNLYLGVLLRFRECHRKGWQICRPAILFCASALLAVAILGIDPGGWAEWFLD